MLPTCRDYPSLKRTFRWKLPARFNMAEACLNPPGVGRDAPAILNVLPDGRVEPWSFAALDEAASRLANALAASGIRPGDRIGILLPQAPEAAITHFAAWKLGAISVPMSVLFGPEALRYRLNDSGAACLVTAMACAEKLKGIRGDLIDLRLVVGVGGKSGEEEAGIRPWDDLLRRASDRFASIASGLDDPALMIYTSGTTGLPKGALHGHRVLLGHLTGFQFSHEFLPRPGDRVWTPADWAWAGGLLNALLPALYFGVPVVACRSEKFDPEAAFDLMARLEVRNAFIPPTALKMLRSVPNPRRRFDLSLRTIGSAGEALGREAYEWSRAALGLSVNEFYGQTECNYVLSSCAALEVTKPGAIGKAVPGHDVAIMGSDGAVLPPGEEGQIAIRAPDPVMFLSYWKQPEATREKFHGAWLLTGDQGVADEDGYIRFIGRDDDVITSAGYRIGPVEIEDCLIAHPAVRLAAAIGKPDPLRTEIVKAFIVLNDGHAPGEALAQHIRSFVRDRLSAHEYPREVAFVEAMPLTTSGKVIRRHFRDAVRREAGLSVAAPDLASAE